MNARETRWYALEVQGRKEKAAVAGLLERGFEIFLPTRLERRPWSDRIRTLEVALFPGYLFVHTALDASIRIELLKVKQVRELVARLQGDARIARSIPDWEIESLRTVVSSQRALDATHGLVRGTDVMVAAGPLRGARGVVLEAPDGRRRLVVQIALLGRGVRTVLGADDVLVEAKVPSEG